MYAAAGLLLKTVTSGPYQSCGYYYEQPAALHAGYVVGGRGRGPSLPEYLQIENRSPQKQLQGRNRKWCRGKGEAYVGVK